MSKINSLSGKQKILLQKHYLHNLVGLLLFINIIKIWYVYQNLIKPDFEKTRKLLICSQHDFKFAIQNIIGNNYNKFYKFSYILIPTIPIASIVSKLTSYLQPSTPTLTIPILKYVEQSSNLSKGHMFNKSNKQRGQITFQNGQYYEGEIVKLQDVVYIEGQGTLFTDNSKFYIVYEGRWNYNCFHGKGKYYNQYQIESSNDWHFNWKMIEAIFNKGEIIEGKIDFYQTQDVITYKIEYPK